MRWFWDKTGGNWDSEVVLGGKVRGIGILRWYWDKNEGNWCHEVFGGIFLVKLGEN